MSERSVFSEPAGLKTAPRSTRRPRDMVYSMVALLIPIVGMLVLYRFLGGESPTVIDPTPAFTDARGRAAYQVLQPSSVPPGWQPTSARSTKAGDHLVLRVGYTGPDNGFLQLTESSAPAEATLVEAMGANTAGAGVVEAAGRSWRWYTGAKGIKALVLLEPGRTVVLAGQAPDATLTGFVTALR